MIKKLIKLLQTIAELEVEAQRIITSEEFHLGSVDPEKAKRVGIEYYRNGMACIRNFCVGHKLNMRQVLENIVELAENGDYIAQRIEEIKRVDPEVGAQMEKAVEAMKMLIRLAKEAGINLPKAAREALDSDDVTVPYCIIRGDC